MLRLLLITCASMLSALAWSQEPDIEEMDEVAEELAAEASEDLVEEKLDRKPIDAYFGGSVGIKGGASGNYLLQANNVPASNGVLPFEDGAGGWGTAVGMYFEFRAIDQHLGLELDVLFGDTQTWSELTYNNVVKTRWTYDVRTMRIPLLVEGHFGGPNTRVSIGVGPEWVKGKKADFRVDVLEGEDLIDAGVQELLSDSLTAIPQKDTHFVSNIGLAFKVWEMAINLDFRYSYNFGQPNDYLDRVNVDGLAVAGVNASTNMDLHILLGLSYEFGFDLPK